jgi:type I restriction enzyme S subunit
VRVSLRDVCAAVARAEPRTVFKDTFEYVDISSIDPKTRTITEPRTISVNEAPSRARQILKGDDVLFSTVRPYLRNIAHVEKSLDGQFASTGFSVIRPADGICGRYLFHLVNSNAFVATVLPFQRGSSYPAVLDEDVKAIEIPIPPTAEQERIVAALDALFTRLDVAEMGLHRSRLLAGRYRSAILHAAISGELGKGAQEGLRNETIGSLFDVQTGATPLRSEARYYEGGTIPWLTSASVNTDPISEAHQFITDAAIRETNCKLFPAGSLLIAMYGEGTTRGKVAALGIDAATNQACAVLVPRAADSVMCRFVKLWFQYRYEALRGISSGGVQPNLNTGLIKKLAIRVPSGGQVASVVSCAEGLLAEADSIDERVTDALGGITVFRQSVLAAAFRGELVPQDPNDEPVEKLLERIRSRRAAEMPAKRPSRKSRKAAA